MNEKDSVIGQSVFSCTDDDMETFDPPETPQVLTDKFVVIHNPWDDDD